jgi:hypothetical protein
MRFVNPAPAADTPNAPDGLAVASFVVATIALACFGGDDLIALATIGLVAVVNVVVRGIAKWVQHGNASFHKIMDEELD